MKPKSTMNPEMRLRLPTNVRKIGMPVFKLNAPCLLRVPGADYVLLVARLLELTGMPQPADAADALAIAICHIHTAQTLAAQGAGLG